MKLRTRWIPVAVVVLLMAGCGAAAAPVDGPTGPDESIAPDTQAQRIYELEARLDALLWTEQDAIAVVQSKLRERLVACSGEGAVVCQVVPDPLVVSKVMSVEKTLP